MTIFEQSFIVACTTRKSKSDSVFLSKKRLGVVFLNYVVANTIGQSLLLLPHQSTFGHNQLTGIFRSDLRRLARSSIFFKPVSISYITIILLCLELFEVSGGTRGTLSGPSTPSKLSRSIISTVSPTRRSLITRSSERFPKSSASLLDKMS